MQQRFEWKWGWIGRSNTSNDSNDGSRIYIPLLTSCWPPCFSACWPPVDPLRFGRSHFENNTVNFFWKNQNSGVPDGIKVRMRTIFKRLFSSAQLGLAQIPFFLFTHLWGFMVCHLRFVTYERHETHKRNKEETRRLAVLVIFSHHPSNISIECFFVERNV